MRSHAKAPTAGSAQRQATGLGRTRFAPTAVLAVAIASLLAFAATPASAFLLRNHEGSFGAFSGESPQALTVDQSNGDVYALDTAGNRLLRFSSSGAPKNFSAGPNPGTNEISGLNLQDFPSFDQVAVDSSGGPSDGNIYLTQSSGGLVRVFASSGEALGTPLNGSGTFAGSFGEACGVAVDQSNGDVYVASWGNRIWRYSPSGSAVVEGDYSGGIATTTINPCGLAVAGGSLYAKDWRESPFVGAGSLKKYSTSEFALGSPPTATATQVAPLATAVAADPASGDVYVDEGNQVSVFNSVGSPLYSFGSGDFGTSSTGVAVASGGSAYVSDSSTNHRVDIYGPFSAPPPIVETKAATSVKHVKATLHGHLDHNNSLPITGCEFEWGTDTSYTETPVPCAEGNSFNAASDVSAELSGLIPGTTYHFRLHVTTGSGGFSGEDKSFEATPPSSVPEAESGEGSIVSSTSSQLKGTINPNANPLTDCRFEYVSDLAFQFTGFADLSSGGSVPCDQAPGSIPADFEDHEVTATATGLDPEQVYRFRLVAENANGPGNGADALVPGPPLVETTGSTYRTTTTARFDSRVSPHGADTHYWFEYVTDAQLQASGFADAVSTPHEPLVVDEVQRVNITVGNVLDSEKFKLGFGGYTTPDLTFATPASEVQAALSALPSIGSGNVHVAFAQYTSLEGAYIVTFQGVLGNTDVEQLEVSKGGSMPVSSIEVSPFWGLPGGGTSDRTSFVSAPVAGLQPNTAYHYRVVADNGTPGGPAFGADMTLTTRASDVPLSHGHLPGPSGSDRAWEQVNAPDIGGNGVDSVSAISDNGDRAIYGVNGGTPVSEVGSSFGGNQLFAERTPNGWQPNRLFATRAEAAGNRWDQIAGRSDLSRLLTINWDTTRTGLATIWGLSPGLPAQLVAEFPAEDLGSSVFTAASEDGLRSVAVLQGSLDPDHPVNTDIHIQGNLYELSSGRPRLVGLLPDGSVPSCGALNPFNLTMTPRRSQHWVSADGSRVFFQSGGNGPCDSGGNLYVRDLKTETTTQISSGAEVFFLRATADAAFFTTTSSLVPEDEGGKDVYRYGLEDEKLECVTCFPGIIADVSSDQGNNVAISDDGSRLYFLSPHRLLPGAASPGLYRVDVASGALAYVAPISSGDRTGDRQNSGNAISPDGSVFVFRSGSPALNSLNGPQNGVTFQYYRYDDNDRSLVCVSCPADGSSPRGEVSVSISRSEEIGPNLSPLFSNGDLSFATPTPLVSADQNTAGPGQGASAGADLYEWRDGRLLLVTDGLTASVLNGGESPSPPEIVGATPSGHDIFFFQAARLTPDALDANRRLYDARIGGGFEFPTPPPPCPLEACQGTPRGVPEESRPGSADFAGAGDAAKAPARCRKGKVRRSGRCVAKKHKRQRAKKRSQHRANHDRRASR